jgi:hypothetical protein
MNINTYFYHNSLIFSYDEKFFKLCRENQNTHFVFSNCFFFFENRAVYEIM